MVSIATMTQQVRHYDRRIEQIAETDHPQTCTLRQVAGIGPVTSLGYVLASRTRRASATVAPVGAYLGLCPRRYHSGESEP